MLAPYFSPQQQFQPQPQFQSQPQPDERIWVQNANAAESYLLAPGGFARLWDSSLNRFYERRADITGRPLPTETYEYKRISPQMETVVEETRKLSTEEINAKFEAITKRIEELEKVRKGAGRNAKQSDADDSSV